MATKTGEIQKTYLEACEADRVFETYIKVNGFKSRWDWKPLNGQVLPALEHAYRAKLAADAAHARAWAEAGVMTS